MPPPLIAINLTAVNCKTEGHPKTLVSSTLPTIALVETAGDTLIR